MPQHMQDTHILIYGARRPGRPNSDCWMVVEGTKIDSIGHGAPPEGAYDRTVDARGALLLPGAIDCHVHFREPGMTQKATIASESRAAAAGGVTSFIEMPNTRPATTTIPLWQEKSDIAARGSLINYAFFLGASDDNINVLLNADFHAIPGVKVFMGSSTGSMSLTASTLERVFREVKALVAVHAEDNDCIAANLAAVRSRCGDDIPVAMHTMIRNDYACYAATAQAVELALRYGTRLHLCHLTTADELTLLPRNAGAPGTKQITSEVSPHHLLFTSDDYPRLGSRIKMNPSVKGVRDRLALRRALGEGIIDMAATDHAPHLLSEKAGDALTAASGAPAVQFALPVLLSLYDETTVERVYCNNPADVYHIDRRGRLTEGNYADFALVESTEPYTVDDSMVLSPCGWTPMDGLSLNHRVSSTWVNGHEVYRAPQDGSPSVFAATGAAMPLRFTKR